MFIVFIVSFTDDCHFLQPFFVFTKKKKLWVPSFIHSWCNVCLNDVVYVPRMQNLKISSKMLPKQKTQMTRTVFIYSSSICKLQLQFQSRKYISQMSLFLTLCTILCSNIHRYSPQKWVVSCRSDRRDEELRLFCADPDCCADRKGLSSGKRSCHRSQGFTQQQKSDLDIAVR